MSCHSISALHQAVYMPNDALPHESYIVNQSLLVRIQQALSTSLSLHSQRPTSQQGLLVQPNNIRIPLQFCCKIPQIRSYNAITSISTVLRNEIDLRMRIPFLSNSEWSSCGLNDARPFAHFCAKFTNSLRSESNVVGMIVFVCNWWRRACVSSVCYKEELELASYPHWERVSTHDGTNEERR